MKMAAFDLHKFSWSSLKFSRPGQKTDMLIMTYQQRSCSERFVQFHGVFESDNVHLIVPKDPFRGAGLSTTWCFWDHCICWGVHDFLWRPFSLCLEFCSSSRYSWHEAFLFKAWMSLTCPPPSLWFPRQRQDNPTFESKMT